MWRPIIAQATQGFCYGGSSLLRKLLLYFPLLRKLGKVFVMAEVG